MEMRLTESFSKGIFPPCEFWDHIIVKKLAIEGLEKWCNGDELWLFSQTTQVQFPAPHYGSQPSSTQVP